MATEKGRNRDAETTEEIMRWVNVVLIALAAASPAAAQEHMHGNIVTYMRIKGLVPQSSQC
jgi:hypothetical protein